MHSLVGITLIVLNGELVVAFLSLDDDDSFYGNNYSCNELSFSSSLSLSAIIEGW